MPEIIHSPGLELDTFLEEICHEELKGFLLASPEPVWESELLKIAFPDINVACGDSLSLFQSHFALFHKLYLMQNELFDQNLYLHIHFMRTVVRSFPEPGCCREFLEENSEFCGAECCEESTRCRFHFSPEDQNALDRLSEKYFYLEKNNFKSLTAETADKFINGAWQLLQNHDDYRKCLAVMGLPEGVTVDLLKKRFRYLARTMHPDLVGCHNNEFAQINAAYRKLLAYLGAL